MYVSIYPKKSIRLSYSLPCFLSISLTCLYLALFPSFSRLICLSLLFLCSFYSSLILHFNIALSPKNLGREIMWALIRLRLQLQGRLHFWLLQDEDQAAGKRLGGSRHGFLCEIISLPLSSFLSQGTQESSDDCSSLPRAAGTMSWTSSSWVTGMVNPTRSKQTCLLPAWAIESRGFISGLIPRKISTSTKSSGTRLR